jgi:cation:H+ antiporter
MHWIQFFISALFIVIAGVYLTVYADKLSDRLNLGKVWIGIVLLGFVTSLPEAVTSIFSVAALKATDLAVGNLVGSNNFNPILIVVMDLVYRRGSVTDAVPLKASHKVSALFAMCLAAIVGLEIAFVRLGWPHWHIGSVSLGCWLIAVLYFVGMRKLAFLSKGESDSSQKKEVRESLPMIIWHLIFSAFVVVVCSIFLAESADAIAVETNLGRTLVGTIMLAFVTSLPEMVVSLSALNIGSLDLAIGNIFGSNMTNMFILFLCDVFYLQKPLLTDVAAKHIFTVLLGLCLVYMLLFGIYRKNKKVFFGMGWDTLAMLGLFILGTFVIQYGVK